MQTKFKQTNETQNKKNIFTRVYNYFQHEAVKLQLQDNTYLANLKITENSPSLFMNIIIKN